MVQHIGVYINGRYTNSINFADPFLYAWEHFKEQDLLIKDIDPYGDTILDKEGLRKLLTSIDSLGSDDFKELSRATEELLRNMKNDDVIRLVGD